MKLRFIFIMAMVTIMAMAGGAFAANLITNSTTNTVGDAQYQHNPPCAGLAGNPLGNTPPNCPYVESDTFGNNPANSGTGFIGGMPAQVAYSAAVSQYTAGVGPTTGYLLNGYLFGMCAGAVNNSTTCSKFIPTGDTGGPTAFSFTNDAQFIAATGGDGTQIWSWPLGTANFNQGTFETGLVTGMATTATQNGTSGAMFNSLSQQTFHHAAGAAGADGDYIDQRLAQAMGTVIPGQTFRQHVIAQAGAGGTVVANTTTGALDSGWIGNPDGAGGFTQNTGVVWQAVGDTMAGLTNNALPAMLNAPTIENGSYGQIFHASDSIGTNSINPGGIDTTANYNALSSKFTANSEGVGATTLP